MKTLLSFVALAGLVLQIASPPAANGQSAIPVGYVEHEFRLTEPSISVQLYRPIDPQAKTLIAIVEPTFKADAGGRLVVDLSQPVPGQTQAELTIYLEHGAPAIMAQIAKRLDMPIEQIQIPRLSNLTLKQLGHGPIFEPLAVEGTLNTTEIPLTAQVDAANVAELAEGLRSGAIKLRFQLAYQVEVVQVGSEGSWEAKLAAEEVTAAMNELFGGAEGLQVGASPQGLAVKTGAVTRKQFDTLKSVLRRRVEQRLELVGTVPGEAQAMLTRADAFIESLFQKAFIEADGEIARKLRELRVEFDRADLTPGIFEDIIASLKTFFESEDKYYSFTDVHASAGVLGIFNAEANVKYTKDELRKRLEAADFQFSLVGKNYIPKGLSVRVQRDENLNLEAKANLYFRAMSRGRMRVSSIVTTASMAKAGGGDDLIVSRKLKALTRQRQDLRRDQLRLQAKISEARKSLVALQGEVQACAKLYAKAYEGFVSKYLWAARWEGQQGWIKAGYGGTIELQHQVYASYGEHGKTGLDLVRESTEGMARAAADFEQASERYSKAIGSLEKESASLVQWELQFHLSDKALDEIQSQIDLLIVGPAQE